MARFQRSNNHRHCRESSRSLLSKKEDVDRADLTAGLPLLIDCALDDESSWVPPLCGWWVARLS